MARGVPRTGFHTARFIRVLAERVDGEVAGSKTVLRRTARRVALISGRDLAVRGPQWRCAAAGARWAGRHWAKRFWAKVARVHGALRESGSSIPAAPRRSRPPRDLRHPPTARRTSFPTIGITSPTSGTWAPPSPLRATARTALAAFGGPRATGGARWRARTGLGARERSLLATVPVLLGKRFARLHQAQGWRRTTGTVAGGVRRATCRPCCCGTGAAPAAVVRTDGSALATSLKTGNDEQNAYNHLSDGLFIGAAGDHGWVAPAMSAPVLALAMTALIGAVCMGGAFELRVQPRDGSLTRALAGELPAGRPSSWLAHPPRCKMPCAYASRRAGRAAPPGGHARIWWFAGAVGHARHLLGMVVTLGTAPSCPWCTTTCTPSARPGRPVNRPGYFRHPRRRRGGLGHAGSSGACRRDRLQAGQRCWIPASPPHPSGFSLTHQRQETRRCRRRRRCCPRWRSACRP